MLSNSHPTHRTAKYICIICPCPLSINTKFQKQLIHSYRPLHNDLGLLHCSQCPNLQFSSVPLQFCIPHCITILLHHLEFIFFQSSSPAASLGPWGTIPRSTKPLPACLLLTCAFPNGHGQLYCDHMQVCMAIAQPHRPNLGRFDACRISHSNVPIIWYATW